MRPSQQSGAVAHQKGGTEPVLEDVDTPTHDPARFRAVIGEEAFDRFTAVARSARDALAGRVVWNVNTTARGGGVAEMLRPLLGYAAGGGLEARWVVVCGDEPFFRVTKRIHHRLHGSPGDEAPLDAASRAEYDAVLTRAAARLRERVRPGDVVILHDPQTAGLAGALREHGAVVIWRCHIGTDRPNDLARETWRFLAADVAAAQASVFSRRAFVWEGLDEDRVSIVHPSIDAFTPKNQALRPEAVLAILGQAGILREGREAASERTAAGPDGLLDFTRTDGSSGRFDTPAVLVGEAVPPDVPMVLQVSRWDPLKDPVGVLQAFTDHVAGHHPDAWLVLAGPDVSAVSDDPEGAETLRQVTAAWGRLPDTVRERVSLVSLPMEDQDQNALMVNALQRHATVIVQKSLAEGFGLTVAEAMWKGRPVVASAVGGIRDQIVDGVCGLLVADPQDPAECGRAVRRLLADPAAAAEMGERAHRRARDDFLAPRHLSQYADLVSRLL